MDIYDPDIPISIGQTSQPMTIIAVSDGVTVLAYGADLDGGIKALNIWATYTYYKPGQTSGPGVGANPTVYKQRGGRRKNMEESIHFL